MKQKVLLTLLLVLSCVLGAYAQNGKLAGRITDADSKEPLIGASIQVLSGGSVKGKAVTDANGDYMTGPLSPGQYDVVVRYISYQDRTVRSVAINFEKTTRLDVKMSLASKSTGQVDVVYKRPLIDKDGSTNGAIIGADQIKNFGTRDISSMINISTPGAYQADRGGGINLKGTRTGDNAVFINGVRQFGTAAPPAETIEEVAIITGGIPAQYGDAIGGVISYTTKKAASKRNGGIQLESSSPFDGYHYNLLGASITGPLVKTKEYTNSSGAIIAPRTLIGGFSSLQMTYFRENDPSAYGYRRLREDSMDAMRANPIVLNPQTGSFVPRGSFYTRDAFERVAARPNNDQFGVNYTGSFDFQPTENTLITLGGTVNYNRTRSTSYLNLFNTENNPLNTNLNYNVFLRLSQTFNGKDENALVKNIFYQLQIDLSENRATTQDINHRDNLALYNYAGKFREIYGNQSRTGPTTIQVIDANGGSTSSRPINGNYVLLNAPIGLEYTGGGANPGIDSWNAAYLRLRPEFLSNFTSSVTDLNGLSSLGFGLNGGGVPGIGVNLNNIINGTTQFANFGNTSTGYSKSYLGQIRLSGQASAEIMKHTIKVGFEFEQRDIASYSWGIGDDNMWGRGRGLINNQFTDRFGLVNSAVVNGVTQITTAPVKNLDENGNMVGQTDFDRNLRRRLGLDPNASQWLVLDSINPNLLTRDLFSARDIFAGGINPISNYQGYDPLGNRVSGTRTLEQFFLDTNAREVGAFRPNYVAGYIEDKFELRDVTLRLGLRVDRFDLNQQVLRDQWSLTRLNYVGQTNMSGFSRFGQLPPNVSPNAAIIVNNNPESYNGTNQNAFEVIGYREGARFYDANGNETNNFRDLLERSADGNLYQWFDVTGIQNDPARRKLFREARITTDAFTDYKPQVNWMPRVAFSFPISDQALFFAHYDVLTQRPAAFNGAFNFASPYSYYALNNAGNTVNPVLSGAQYIINPNLRPQRKVDYEVGFQQALNANSALKITAAYSEYRDLIAVIRIQGGFPQNQYNTDGNQDFGTVKSLTMQYDLRKTENLTFQASYALQFAETSASNFAAAQLNNTRNAALRNVTPADYDSRHGLKFNMDYRLAKDQGPNIFGKKYLENAGVNLSAVAVSGTPYTRILRNYTASVIDGQPNASRLPWNTRLDLRINKEFYFGETESGRPKTALNVYLYVQNLLDMRNVLGVYGRTGSNQDDGFLASSQGQQLVGTAVAGGAITRQALIDYYNLSLLNPNLVSQPRWIRVGVQYSF